MTTTREILTIVLLLDSEATLLADPPKLFDALAVRLKLLTALDDAILNGSVVKFVFDVL